jgi:hypothetical protein
MANFCKFAKAIKKHFETDGRNLEAALKEAGANADEAKQIEKYINNRVKSATGKQKAEIIKKALGDNVKKEYKQAFERLIDDSHGGGLNEIKVKNTIGETLGVTSLKPEQRKLITDLANQLQKAPMGSNERKFLSARLSVAIQDVSPVKKSDMAKTLMFTGDLLNTTTLMKNTLGNAMYAVYKGVNAQFAGALDWAFVGMDNNFFRGNAKRERFIQWEFQKAYKDFITGLQEGARDAWLGINTTNIATDTYNSVNRQVFKDFKVFGKTILKENFNPLAYMEKLTKVALGAPDRAFYKMASGQELLQLMKAAKKADPTFNGVPTSEMFELAHLEGLKATFQDNSLAAQAASQMKKSLNYANIGGIGFGDVAITYTKTVSNLLTRAVEMTPLKLIGTGIDLIRHFKGQELVKRGKITEDIANVILGTNLIAGGAALTNLGIITGRLPSQEEGANRQAEGEQSFSINMSALRRWVYSGLNKEAAKSRKGDKLIGYGWAQPIAIPLAIGAEIANNKKNKLNREQADSLEQMLQLAEVAPSVLAEQSFLKGLRDVLKTEPDNQFAGVQKVVAGSAGRFIPFRSLMGQIARQADNTQRETYDKNLLVKTGNQIRAQVPGYSKNLPAKVDVGGEEIKRGSDDVWFRALQTFVSPAQITKIKKDPQIAEVLDIYNKTGEKSGLLKQADKKITIKDMNGNRASRQLNNRELGKYQTFLGRESKAIIGEALQDTAFGELSDEEKADIFGKVIKNTNQAAKIKLFGHNPERVSLMAEAILNEDTDLIREELANLIDKRVNKTANEDENEEYEGYQQRSGS